ncbi:MAG: nitroreductase family protein [Deltaproteobacteria bacterium]|nr:nitroreductase family protein [Deltaproteobacteria bacterium]
MLFRDLVEKRRSIRAFEDRSLEDGMLEVILQAANRAPSAGNLQAYEIVCVSDKGRRDALAGTASRQEFLADAPVVLAFFAHPRRSSTTYGSRGANLYCVQDATIACAYAELMANDLGLASVWIGAFDGPAVAQILGAPADVWPVALLPLGYGREQVEEAARSTRRELAELVKEERF